MTPQTVNAYYNASNNEIVFPAAILQPPFFDMNADDAVNYGAIGAVIGHEIGHGFDDQGSKSDGAGNLRDWWTPSDAAAFKERTQKLGAEYAAINPIDDLHINGGSRWARTSATTRGLMQAYRAYRISLGGKEAPVIGGLTGDQRFFMGYAQIWRTKFRDAALRNQLLTNPHSPGMVARVRAAHEQRCLHEGVRREGGRQDVAGSEGSREDLVRRQRIDCACLSALAEPTAARALRIGSSAYFVECSVAIQRSTTVSSTSSGRVPFSKTTSWKPRMSNLLPSLSSARLRSSWILISPIM